MFQLYEYYAAVLITSLLFSGIKAVDEQPLKETEALNLGNEVPVSIPLALVQPSLQPLPHSGRFNVTLGRSAKNKLPKSCAEALANCCSGSGIYLVHLPRSGLNPFYVYCLVDPLGGPAWTVVQRRQDGNEDFYRSWQDYKYGFGNLEGEFFIGLEQLHALTSGDLQELNIEMCDFSGQSRFAYYDSFAIGNENAKYVLNVLGKFHGNGGDSLTYHAGQQFTTYDADNDIWPDGNCAVTYMGAWWHKLCHESNFNGKYFKGGDYEKNFYGQGINWDTWHGYYYSLKYVHMAIRPAYS